MFWRFEDRLAELIAKAVKKINFTSIFTATTSSITVALLFSTFGVVGGKFVHIAAAIVWFLAVYMTITKVGKWAYGDAWFGKKDKVFTDTFQIKEITNRTKETKHMSGLEEAEKYLEEIMQNSEKKQ